MFLFLLGISPIFAQECGDVNTDGSVDVVDAMLCAQYYISEGSVTIAESLADVNGDGTIDIVDALLIAQYYVGLMDQLDGCSITPTPTSEFFNPWFAVNCGGSAYTAADGIKFDADKAYSGGSTTTNTKSIADTTDPDLYHSERYGNSTYSIEAPNGEYKVTLYMAENYHASSDLRSFNVKMEDTQMISELDVFKAAGASTAYITEKEVTVSDGELNIEFITVLENALINAIKVDALSLSGEPVAKFSIDPQRPKPDESISFDASDSYDWDGTIVSYSWDFGHGNPATGLRATHTYPEGNYEISLTVTDNEGKSSSTSKKITVSDKLGTAEDTGIDLPVGSPQNSNKGSSTVLPDPFTMWNGSQVKDMEDWRWRRRELVVELEKKLLGEKAPPPALIGGRVSGSVSNTRYTVNVENPNGSTSFSGSVKLPSTGSPPYPAVIYLVMPPLFNSPNIDAGLLNSEGIATMSYDVNQISSEASKDFTTGKYFDANPDYKGKSGALIAWAWGVSRIIDMLEKDPGLIDPAKIAINGCSRLGKGAFVIGAFDERIALGLPLEPGTGGPAPIRAVNVYGGQSLSNCIGEASWFGPNAGSLSSSWAVDMSDVACLYAPRGLLMMDNPHIDHLSYKANYLGVAAASELYKAMGKVDAIWYLGSSNDSGHCNIRSEYNNAVRAMIRKFMKGDNTVTTGGLQTHSNHGNINVSSWTSTWEKGTITQ